MFAMSNQCEMCGNKVSGPLKTVRIEGATLQVCNQCARFGTEIQGGRKPDVRGRPGTAPAGVRVTPGHTIPSRRPRDVLDLMEGEIVDDYGTRIRDARMAKGWTQKDLALQIMERELLIKKLEKAELIPEDELRKKLEKVLEIRLIDMTLETKEIKHPGPITPTLGDVTLIKRPQK
jgi:putative transcription factor